MADAVAPARWFGHPRGLATLFFTEMWERFSYYGMRALLILYMTALVSSGGLGFSTEKAAAIYGWYTFLVYATGIPGGFIADRWLGHFRAVFVGGIIIAIGHFCLAIPGLTAFYFGLGLIVCGTGLLKPNVSTMVGLLYSPNDARRDGGFSIFYMGINLGAAAAPLVCGYLGQRIGWHWGFAAAGVGMVFGLVQYYFGRRHLPTNADAVSIGQKHSEPSPSGGASEKLTAAEWKRLGVIAALFIFAILFWAAFEQGGSSLNLFADRYTQLSFFGFEFPSSWFQSLNAVYVLLFAPIFSWLWVALGPREPSSPAKFVCGLLLVGLGFLLLAPASGLAQAGTGVRVSPMWLVGAYLLHTLGELCLSPVGLSMVTKLAPLRLVGSIMGIWFLTNAFGNKVGGMIASYFERLPLPQLFGAVAVVTIGSGILLLIFVRPIKKMMGGVK
ncbi:MAG: peptide MFS transporter [Verrucomicrobia bacterium]|nr:peptide MFS transporter [Verrucomicrobiota bacterium]